MYSALSVMKGLSSPWRKKEKNIQKLKISDNCRITNEKFALENGGWNQCYNYKCTSSEMVGNYVKWNG